MVFIVNLLFKGILKIFFIWFFYFLIFLLVCGKCLKLIIIVFFEKNWKFDINGGIKIILFLLLIFLNFKVSFVILFWGILLNFICCLNIFKIFFGNVLNNFKINIKIVDSVK